MKRLLNWFTDLDGMGIGCLLRVIVLIGILSALIAALAAISLSASAQKVKQGSVITVTNFAWNCGGYSPQKAYVVKRKGKLFIKFDFEYGGTEKPQYLSIDSAFRYWVEEETRIVLIK